MLAGDGVVLDADVAILTAAEHHGLVCERVAATHRGAARINVDQARLARRSREQPLGGSNPGIGNFFAHAAPGHGNGKEREARRASAASDRTGLVGLLGRYGSPPATVRKRDSSPFRSRPVSLDRKVS